jgi:hypothetical protein
MSFGYGVGDIIAVTTLAFKAVQNTRQACGQYDELTREVTSLHIVLSRLQREAENPSSLFLQLSDSEKQELGHIVASSGEVLKILNVILEKYDALSEENRSVTKILQQIRFGTGEMQDLSMIRSQLSSQTASLALFLHLIALGSQGRVERQMAMQMGALQELQHSINLTNPTVPAVDNRESSILTTYENDDKDFWKDFRRELIAEGCSSEVMARHRGLIMDYIRELDSNGGVKRQLELEPVQSSNQLDSEASGSAIFDFDNEVVNSRIYTRVLASASVRNSLVYSPITITPRHESADWPLPTTNQLPNMVVSGKPKPLQLEKNAPDVPERPPPTHLKNLQPRPRKDFVTEIPKSKLSLFPSLDSVVPLPTVQPGDDSKAQKTQQNPTSNKTSVADESRPAMNPTIGSYRFLEEFKLVMMGAVDVDKSLLVAQVIFLECIIHTIPY